MAEIGTQWMTHPFPKARKRVRVVVLPWDGFVPLNARRLNRVALCRPNGDVISAFWWRSDDDLYPIMEEAEDE